MRKSLIRLVVGHLPGSGAAESAKFRCLSALRSASRETVRLELAEPERLAARALAAKMIGTLPTDDKIAKFAGYSTTRDLR